MREFTYIIKDRMGIHAQPASLLAAQVRACATTLVTITKGDRTVNAAYPMKIMSLGVKMGDMVTVALEGDEEEKMETALFRFFQENL